MSGGVRDSIVQHRQEHAPDGEPLITDTRHIQKHSEGSLRINIASNAADILGFDVGDEVEIRIYLDRYEVRPIQEE